MSEISDTEYEVMEVLWEHYPSTSTEIIKRLNAHKPWHEKTVKTLLNRLVKKGAVGFEKQQRHYLYSPLIDKDDYLARQGQTFIQRLFKGRLSPLVAGFANSQNLSKDDVQALKQLISKWEQENDE